MALDFQTAARLASATDNVAIAIRTLDAGTSIRLGTTVFSLRHTVLEGHRFAIRSLQLGDMLTSWGQPFGTALLPIHVGDYICNEAMLRELSRRSLEFFLPTIPNFADQIAPFVFNQATFHPASALAHYEQPLTFNGYVRPGKRGVGTRNMIALLGTSSLTGGFVRALETQLKPLAARYTRLDGIVAVAHTEGGSDHFNNGDLLLRTLAGLITHPNIGAILIVDRGSESINNTVLHQYMEQHDYPLGDVIHHFMSLSGSFHHDLDAAVSIVQDWFAPVTRMTRSTVHLSELKVGLQCGGSDAFSGISGNPLAAWVAKEIIRYGGSANLAETDELIGAEAYVLAHISSLDNARKFLHFVERFKTWTGWHGQTADGNPSGGNLYRGLYNIYLKSLGAAAKQHPDVRIDAVIEYAESMREPGFYFMDSPGNDLESVTGQVAAGCNMIFFVTGNGSITNFPFVPTLKIVTTSQRYELLSDEMDVNAGAYLEGIPLADIGQTMLIQTIHAASGRLTAGEQAGHAQVQIWRDWQQTGTISPDAIPLLQHEFSREPLPIRTEIDATDVRLQAFRAEQRFPTEQVGLILPTSLCSGQIARIAVEALNQYRLTHDYGVSRFVTLIHTEGCGSSVGRELHDTLLGYLTHPLVKHALLLEHGCEKTHNGYLQQLMAERGLDATRFGWASIQLDGGIQSVLRKMADWFSTQIAVNADSNGVGLPVLRVGLLSQGDVSDHLAMQLATLTRLVVAAGGSVVLPQNDPLLAQVRYQRELHIHPKVTLGYAQTMKAQGFHVMEMPSRQWGEMLTGLGAAGVELIVTHIGQHPIAGHPLIPTLQVTTQPQIADQYSSDLDGVFETDETGLQQLIDLMTATLARNYIPQALTAGNTDFLITRGLFGVSL